MTKKKKIFTKLEHPFFNPGDAPDHLSHPSAVEPKLPMS